MLTYADACGAGVSLGLSEVIDNCQKQQLLMHMEAVVETIRKGLCDRCMRMLTYADVCCSC